VGAGLHLTTKYQKKSTNQVEKCKKPSFFPLSSLPLKKSPYEHLEVA
jgi:hypothetical protein